MTSTLTEMFDTQQFANFFDTEQYLNYLDVMKNAQQAFTEAFQSLGGAFDGGKSQPASTWPPEPVQPREFVENTFGFVERLVAAQKQLAMALVDPAVSDPA
jgi:hypothetical protein